MKKLISTMLFLGIIFINIPPLMAADFSDVSSVNINKEAINYLKTNKVLSGYSDNTFKPDNRINRAEFIKIMVGSLVASPTGTNCFTDVKKEWYAPYICTAKRMGWISGYADGSFKPGNFINFAEASKIVSAAYKVKTDTAGTNKEWFAGYVNGLAKAKAIPDTVQFFDKDVSRAEMAEMVWRLKAKKTDKVSATYQELTDPLPSISSCDGLLEKFKAYNSRYTYPAYYRSGGIGMDRMMEEAVPTAAPSASGAKMAEPSEGEGEAASDYSQTNIQVEGVDEADIIKNDDQYIYTIKDDTVRIIKAYPAKSLDEVGVISFSNKNFNPQEMFIDGDRLVVIGRAWTPYEPQPLHEILRIMPPRPYFSGNKTKVYIVDIKDRKNPKEIRTLTFDGDYSTSRRIGDQMLLVMNERPDVWIMSEIDGGDKLLPQFNDGDTEAQPLVKCGDIHYFPGFARPNYLIVASIPLDDAKGDVEREVLLGSSDNVYSSLNNLYVATSQVDYEHYTDWDWRTDHTNTNVYKFAIQEGKVEFKGRGSVPGTILNQFSMDERGAWFRIATTKESWNSDSPSENNVFVLDEDMKTVGELTDIAPGERIYSTRFLGDRLYMVTFQRVDPLFVISLKDPTKPEVLGKLKIPGFSDYLHPYDDNHIIGFGKDTEEDKGFVKMRGFKMAMFDVTDVTSPKQEFVEFIGDQGTSSELLNNHKALLFDKEKKLLAFPIEIREKVTPAEMDCTKYRYNSCPSMCYQRCIPTSCTVDADGRSNCTSDCDGAGSCTAPEWEQYNTTFMGAVVYTIDAASGFKLRGRVTHYDNADMLKMGDYWPYDWNKNVERALYMGDVLYTVSRGLIKANDLNTIKELNSLKVD